MLSIYMIPLCVKEKFELYAPSSIQGSFQWQKPDAQPVTNLIEVV